VTRFVVGASTDVGQVRSTNQDAKLVAPNLFGVADGMGGHQGGEVASAMAVETFRAEASTPTVAGMVAAVQAANRAIFDRSVADPDVRGMGTTLCALALVVDDDGADQVMIINVGDSRAYRYRADDLSQLTRDHSLVEDLRAEGRLTEQEAAVHPHRNIITRALGTDPEVEVDHVELAPVTGDRYLLCSDGLFNEVSTDRIAATLRRLADPDEASRELVRLANEHGGRDNITVVVVDIHDGDGSDEGQVVGAGSPAPGDAPARGERRDRTEVAAAAGPAGSALTPEEDVAGFGTTAKAGPGKSGADGAADGRAAVTGKPAEPRIRRLTWRVALFVVIVLAVLAAAVGAVGWYARRTYFVGVKGNEVTIFKGQPGGVLWFDPTVAEDTGVTLEQMPAQYRDELRKGHSASSLSDAHGYVRRLEGIAAAQGLPKPSSTTAAPTTEPATPTTAAPTTTKAP
jgi:protein phosphatase